MSCPSRRRPGNIAEGETGGKVDKRAKTTEEEVEITGVIHTSEKGIELEGPPAIFEPDFTCSDGQLITVADSQLITVADSLLDNQHLAMTLLNEIALPKDVDLLRRGKADNMAELCYYAMKVHPCYLFVS